MNASVNCFLRGRIPSQFNWVVLVVLVCVFFLSPCFSLCSRVFTFILPCFFLIFHCLVLPFSLFLSPYFSSFFLSAFFIFYLFPSFEKNIVNIPHIAAWQTNKQSKKYTERTLRHSWTHESERGGGKRTTLSRHSSNSGVGGVTWLRNTISCQWRPLRDSTGKEG